jgi:alpha-L-rhamnosidase
MKHQFYRFLSAFLLIVMVVSGGCSGEKGIRTPQNLQCEYQTNPLGIDSPQPRLFWQLNDQRRGAMQTAYQIIVSSSPDNLSQDKGDIWDSGKIDSDQSAHVVYKGPKLQSHTRYYWKVKSWDKEGQPSTFSDPAWWETGILSADEWQAEWVGGDFIEEIKEKKKQKWSWGYWIWHPQERGIDKKVYFRNKFVLPAAAKVQSAKIRMTADNYFTAFFNGKEVGKGNAWGDIYEFDVKKLLKKNNIIAIEAANKAGDVAGMLFSLKVVFSDGKQMMITPDKKGKGWKVINKKTAGWKDYNFSDSGWQKVKVIASYESSDWGLLDEVEGYKAPQPTLVRHEFKIDKKIKKARVYASGLGGYEMYVNGSRVGDAVFTPGWTDYPKRIQYQTYDVTDLLNKGENAVGAILGNLWWSSGLGWRGSVVYSKGPQRFFMQMIIDYNDGSSQTIVTDKSWKSDLSPILESTLYHGETYDARLEQQGWSKAGFNDGKWKAVTVFPKESAKLVAQHGPFLRVVEEIKPLKITSPKKDVYVFDMGQNFAGWERLKVKGEKGTKIQLRFAETLQPDGNVYRENLRSARATDAYICKGQGTEVWQPRFTYHGYRYVEVTGYPGKPSLDALVGLVAHSAPPVIGSFSCSSELINKIQHNIFWGQGSNMYSVPTDCPQRDERLGWMGDAQAFSPTASYNMNMARFFSKWMYDIADGQDEQGAVHDVNPVVVVTNPAKPAWGDAVYIIPWVMHEFYGDKRIISEHYDTMKRWVDFMTSRSKNNLYETKGYGDWVAVVKSPSEPIGSAYYFYGAKLLSEMAAMLGKDDDAKSYKALSLKIAEAYNKKHFNAKKNSYTGDTQTANLLPLVFGIVPDDKKEAVVKTIVENVHKHNDHLTTGFLGTEFLLPVLSDYGYHELAYKVATQKSYPSWGHMVEKGATTIWELWNSDTEGPGMNSRNHFALGSCGEWFYSHLAGIRPDLRAPGFKKIVLAPLPAQGLDWAKGELATAYGKIISHWKRNGNSVEYNFTVPANTSALFHVPFLGKTIKSASESGNSIYQGGNFTAVDGVRLLDNSDDEAVLSLAAGTYHFVVEYSK